LEATAEHAHGQPRLRGSEVEAASDELILMADDEDIEMLRFAGEGREQHTACGHPLPPAAIHRARAPERLRRRMRPSSSKALTKYQPRWMPEPAAPALPTPMQPQPAASEATQRPLRGSQSRSAAQSSSARHPQ